MKPHDVAQLAAPDGPARPEAGFGKELAASLRSGLTERSGRLKAEGWELFRAGAYTRSGRMFQVVSDIEPADIESRIGELFSQLSVGAVRTAVESLRTLTRHVTDPFSPTARMTEAYPERRVAVPVLTFLNTRLGGDRQQVDLRALQALALWHLGRSREAIAIATKLAVDSPNGSYADWVERMRKAQDTRSLPPDRENP
ncbi:MAG: hypothetical protein ACE5EX_11145 [Phycisphaerae bacterium]